VCEFGVNIDMEMADKYAKQQQPAVCNKFRLEDMPQDVSELIGLVTLIFDLLTLKVVC